MTNYTLERTDLEKGLSTVFQSAFTGMCEEIDKAQRADIAVAYYLYRMSKCNDDIKALGYKNVTELAVDRFDFKASTVRNYVNIGSFCNEITVGTGKKVRKKIVTCFYDSENDRDFSRSQMNELQAISINELTYKYKNSDEYDKRIAFNSFNNAIESINNPYALSCATLRRYKDYIVGTAKHGVTIDTPERISALTKYVNGTMSLNELVYNKKGVFCLPDKKANQPEQENQPEQANQPEKANQPEMTSAQILIHVTELMQNAQVYMDTAEFESLCESMIDMISNL